MTKQIRTDTSQNITCTIVAKNISNRKWECKNCPWMFSATCSPDCTLYNLWFIIGSILNPWFIQNNTLFQFSSSKPVSVPGVPYKTISWTFHKLYKRKWHLQIQTLPSYDMQLSGWVWNIDECILAQCTTKEALQGSGRSIQGSFNCGILVSWVGGSGDPRRKWESERGRVREREGERECVEKCCFCLQNDLKEA